MIKLNKSYRFLIFALIFLSISSAQAFYSIFSMLNEINRANRAVILNTVKTLFVPSLDTKQNINESPRLLDSKNLAEYVNEDLIDLVDGAINPEKSQTVTQKKFTFKDLAGTIPQDVKEIVDFLKHPERFKKVGAQMPKGILLVGPPGNGKTSIARAIAGEADAEFFNASASEFIEIYVGTGPKRIRELFEKAHKVVENPNKKAIIFIDELDAIGGRSLGENSEYRNTINELLNQMDGFKQYSSILVIGATNSPNMIDSALKRPGRFDRIVEIKIPDQENRKAILSLYCKRIKCNSNIDIEKLAESTKGFSGAELKNLTNEAAVRAARENISQVTMEHFELALNDLKNRKKY